MTEQDEIWLRNEYLEHIELYKSRGDEENVKKLEEGLKVLGLDKGHS